MWSHNWAIKSQRQPVHSLRIPAVETTWKVEAMFVRSIDIGRYIDQGIPYTKDGVLAISFFQCNSQPLCK